MVGHFAQYYKNGKVKEVCRFDEHGKLDSVDIAYYESGQMSSRVNYIHGQSDSTYTLYFEDGKTWVSGNCKNNCREGKWNIYDKGGNLVFVENYSEQKQEDYGTVVEAFKHFYKNGQEVYSQRDGDDFGAESAVTPPCLWPWPTKAVMSEIDEHCK
jgi:antitoxin component YwqK of YwqJK toxin-antitoxin module